MNSAISFDVQSRASVDAGLVAILTEELTALRERIAQNIRNSGENTTGKTIDSMEINVAADSDGFSGLLTGRPYFATVETGSGPWKSVYFKRAKDGHTYPAPPFFFYQIIKDWMENKHVKGSPYLAARKIMLEGTSLFRQGGRQDIYTNEIPTTIANIQRRFSDVFQLIVIQNLSIR